MQVCGDITIESENGFVIDSIPLQIGVFTGIIYDVMSEEELSKSLCLQFIDPYGDTTFNMLQKRVLATELRKLSEFISDPEQRECLSTVADFIRKYEDAVHVYVKFHGD